MERTYYYMLYLAFSQIKGKKVKKELLADVDLELLYRAGRFHSVTALVSDALTDCEGFWGAENENLRRIFREAKEKSVRKNLLMDIERKKLFLYLEEQGIWYMPLKGVVLQGYYPKAGQRQMADNDILFDGAYQKKVHDWFKNRGYEVASYAEGNHDVYKKAPVYNFEMHTSLYGEQHNDGWEEYYKNIKERLVAETSGELRFTTEDFYIYFLSHAYKHFNGSGTGVKFLLDQQLYLKAHKASMDWQYVEGELKKLGVAAFERESRGLLEALEKSVEELESGDIIQRLQEKLTGTQREELSYLLHSGSYGTMQNYVQKKLGSYETGSLAGKKLRYYRERLFPGPEIMKYYHEIFGKYKILLPLGWVYRMVKRVAADPGRLLKEAELVAAMKEDENE